MRISFATLRPLSTDYARVFSPAVAALARARYEARWNQVPAPATGEGRLRPTASALAGAIAVKGAAVLGFPHGYDAVASRLAPDLLWLAGELEQGDIVIDGLVAIGGRWAWFPKPWLVLPPCGLALLHYSE